MTLQAVRRLTAIIEPDLFSPSARCKIAMSIWQELRLDATSWMNAGLPWKSFPMESVPSL